jgi:Type I phosphodiesterase / nucleotide pyrophosphatase
VLERIDAIVGRLIEAQLAAHPDAVIAIVSDHGFETISRETNFFRAFIDAGLITIDAGGKVAGWEAMPWPSGGSVAIMLARPGDEALRLRVGQLLDNLAADKNNGIAMIAGREEISRMGGNPQASFFVNLASDTTAGGFAGATAPLNRTPRSKGTHGYFPRADNLHATFLIMGKPIARGRNLGHVEMRAIAPTLGQILGAELPEAELPPIPSVLRR